MGKSKSGGGAGGGAGGVPTVTLEQFADSLTGASSSSSSSATVTVSRWDRDDRVFLLRFPSAAAQRDAMGRASVFLEDLDDRGVVVDRIPSGQRGGVANYSGHNMRARDLARFLNRVDATPGAAPTSAEIALRDALARVGVLRTDKSGRWVASGPGTTGHDGDGDAGPVVAAVAGSSNRDEVRDALLHEAMHMVFYTDASWRDACYAHWDDEVAEEDKTRWVAFLKGLRYDGDDRELCVNELQAYMCTERLLFGGGEKGGGRGKRDGKEKDDGGDARALGAMQAKFAAFAAARLSNPPSVGAHTKCVWLLHRFDD